MEKWLILNEFFIIAYYYWYHIKSGTSNFTFIILNLLIYLCLKLIYYIFKDKKIRKCILIIVIIYITIAYIYFDNIFILLLSLNIYFITYYFGLKSKINIVLTIIILFLIDNSIAAVFALISGMNYLFITLFLKSSSKISKLVSENDMLRNKNYHLYDCLNKDESYEKEIEHLSQLKERNKIAQEIHDNIGHTISGSIIQLEAAKLLMNKDIKKSDKMIENTINVLRIGMEKIRSTLRDIKPPSEELGIHNLKFLINKFEKASNIKVHLFYDEYINKISYIQWKVILKNIREATTNTIKYAKASKINIKIEVLNKIIKVEIKDDGIGNLVIKKGLGIIGMEERTENINGKIIIDGSNGFSIIILLPIK